MIKDQIMELAIQQAKSAAKRDEVPVGASYPRHFWKNNRQGKQ